ncbi:hypothetical protein FY036_08310 [Mesorhizobium microcysteis]|uniref:O-antigen ligase family protein n=1 Tax=Neoaquamicrobium microcysteis TaxID=2682781 RepID=A0A5D4GXR1_9HYPH|nr:hypothetical protein [Mesorhizobium microcysteis]TYR33057.1 hypothetical protein FY036_08310 [Mesorhizobium microcysteis]
MTASAQGLGYKTTAPFAGGALPFWVGFPCLLYGLMSLSLRELGELPLLIAVASAAAALTFAGVWPIRGRYMPFFVFSLVIFTLSLAQVMPSSWTKIHDENAALRQWFYVPVLPILIAYFTLALRYSYAFLQKNIVALVLIAAVLSRMSQHLHGIYDPETDVFFYTLTNDVAIVAMLFLVLLFREKRHWLVDATIIAFAFALSSSAQSQLFCLVVLALRLSRRPTLMLIGISAACLSFIAIAPFFAVQLHPLDHNTAVRAILWRDVLQATADTFGLGVGYGTEYIKHRFEEIMPWGWTIGTGPNDIFVATHSSFYDVLLREGVIGLLLFCFWFFHAIRMPARATLHERRFAACVAALLVINSAVNVGLSSISFLFGSAFAVALLAVQRERFEARHGQAAPTARAAALHEAFPQPATRG